MTRDVAVQPQGQAVYIGSRYATSKKTRAIRSLDEERQSEDSTMPTSRSLRRVRGFTALSPSRVPSPPLAPKTVSTMRLWRGTAVDPGLLGAGEFAREERADCIAF